MKISEIEQARIEKSKRLLNEGLALVNELKFDLAYEKFSESHKLIGNADALTYKAWMLSIKGDSKTAMDLCLQAIELDPDFGNPYNDIGTILRVQNKSEEAIPWFEKAIKAKRYEPRQFPHINLANIYLERNDLDLAIKQFKMALKYDRENNNILKTIEQLEQEVGKGRILH